VGPARFFFAFHKLKCAAYLSPPQLSAPLIHCTRYGFRIFPVSLLSEIVEVLSSLLGSFSLSLIPDAFDDSVCGTEGRPLWISLSFLAVRCLKRAFGAFCFSFSLVNFFIPTFERLKFQWMNPFQKEPSQGCFFLSLFYPFVQIGFASSDSPLAGFFFSFSPFFCLRSILRTIFLNLSDAVPSSR